eukprot:1070276-Pyramimonas_sp.AAC.1
MAPSPHTPPFRAHVTYMLRTLHFSPSRAHAMVTSEASQFSVVSRGRLEGMCGLCRMHGASSRPL